MQLKNSWGLTVIAILHGVGLIGITSVYKAQFINLTPVNLLITACIFWFTTPPKWRTQLMGWVWMAIFAIGWGVEWIGVHTGFIFGEYTYGHALGFKWADIPLVIGVNWILVTLSAYALAAQWISHSWGRVVVASGLMVFLDVAIEPVAIEFNFWQWAGEDVPLKNYLGWFVVSLVVTKIWSWAVPEQLNRTHQLSYFVLLLFFLTLNVFMYVDII